MNQMMQILGLRRVITLAALVAVNLCFAALLYLYLSPHNDDLAQRLNTLTAQVSGKRGDLEKLRGEYQIIEQQKAYFGTLQASGFFSDQNRAIARQRIDQIQKFTGVLAAKYNIGAAGIEKTPDADDAGYVVLNSPISIDIDALDDVDFYNFVYWIENSLPGEVSVSGIKLSRPAEVNEATLHQIGSGTATPLIHGTLKIDWRTMVPAGQVSTTPKVQP